ncbi:hypothetical protein [Sphingobium aquiterrae]|uniref:hypothetical protein n=1 Tax=Sphingobium aquiterrae TaxID=2038656 RepID=UPI0030185EB1
MWDNILGRIRTMGPIFVLTVVIPTILSILYFGLIGSDVYISESRFVVRSPEKQSASGLGFFLKSAGFAKAGDEVFAVQDYAKSRDALTALNKGNFFRSAYSRPEIDFINRFPGIGRSDSFESLFKYFDKTVKVEFDTTSSITQLIVRAYTPKDAYQINEKLLEQSEALVNRLNERGRDDLIRFASREVSEAERRASEAALALSSYRNREGVVDPERQATVQLQLISKLQDELITTKTQLVQLRAFTPANPQIEVLQSRVASLGDEIDSAMKQVAGNRGSLAGSAARYQRLQLESQFADRQLASAMASLEEARNEARRKQVYVERIVQPNMPDKALEPRRMRGILATFVLGLVAWGIVTMLLAGLREHKD